MDGVWVAIGADAVIFAILFGSFMQARLKDPALFEASRHTLNMNSGGIDTLILLSSSWSVALAIQASSATSSTSASLPPRGGAHRPVVHDVQVDRVLRKFAEGLTPATNDFYMWYFTLTGSISCTLLARPADLRGIKSRRGALQQLEPGCAGMRCLVLAFGRPAVDRDLPPALPDEGSRRSMLRERVHPSCGWP